jgi:hypothetical protein
MEAYHTHGANEPELLTAGNRFMTEFHIRH